MTQTKYCWGQGKVESLKILCADTGNYVNGLGDQSLQNGTHFSPEWQQLTNSDVKGVVAQKGGLTASVKGRNEQTNRQTKGTAYLGKCSKYSVREMIRLEAERTVIYGSRSIVPVSRCQS